MEVFVRCTLACNDFVVVFVCETVLGTKDGRIMDLPPLQYCSFLGPILALNYWQNPRYPHFMIPALISFRKQFYRAAALRSLRRRTRTVPNICFIFEFCFQPREQTRYTAQGDVCVD